MTKQHYNTAGTHVYLRNPETDGEWWCPVDVAPVFVDKRAWEYAEPRDTSLDGLFDDITADGFEQTGFDPSQHTVEEINAHLSEHAASSPGEVVRVLELEAAGKNRASVKDPRLADSSTDIGD